MDILAFFAHPDDETILAGGLLAYLSECGYRIHYLCCTRGEGGEMGEPALCTRDQLGKVREEEFIAAVKALGGYKWKLLNFIDPLVGFDNVLYPFVVSADDVVPYLRDYIQENSIDIIISHGSNGEYGHPAHRMVYDSVVSYNQHTDNILPWYTVQAYYPNSAKPHLLNKDDPADWIVDIRSVFEKKVNAASAHSTQLDLFLRRKTIELGRPVTLREVIVTEESYRSVASKNYDPIKSILIEAGIEISIVNPGN
ncbi:MAG: hypothetical protein CVU39_20405 [Chloroflexi bacterium HGW-Chloroflexi-10]|nr:MAG: hypothetical protein CVU39_20405 [Chloroflexi bacterium HGW-Chloroflexi-10]